MVRETPGRATVPGASAKRVPPAPVRSGYYGARSGAALEDVGAPTRQGRPGPLLPQSRGVGSSPSTRSVAPGRAEPWGGRGQPAQSPARQGSERPSSNQRVKVSRDKRGRWTVRRVSVLSVLKISLAFYLCVLVVVVVAGAVVWNVADSAGLITKLDKLVRSLFALSSFTLHPLTALVWGGAFVAALCLLGVLVNVVVAVLYNVLSDLVGGVRVLMVSEEETRAASLGYQPTPEGRPSRGYSSAG